MRAPAALRARGLRVFAVLVALGLFTVACSSGSDESGGEEGSSANASELAGLLARVPPGSDGGFLIVASSFDAIDELGGRSRSCESVDAFGDWLRVVAVERRAELGAAPSVLPAATQGLLEDDFGVSLCDVGWAVENQIDAPAPWMFSGDFDVDEVDAAVRANPTWSDVLSVDTSASREFYDWGDELRIDQRSPFRQLGIGGQLAVFPDEAAGRDIAAITTRRELMLDIVDVGDRSVGRDREVAVALPILEAIAPHSVLLVSDAPRWDDSAPSTAAAGLAAPDWALEPYDLLAVAEARDDLGGFAEIVLVHRSALDAEANLAALQRMFDEGESLVDPGLSWGEVLTLESVGARDEVLIARVRPAVDGERGVVRTVLESIYRGDSLLVAE